MMRRFGRPIVIDGAQRAQITALSYSDAPEGHDRWTVRLLAEKVVEAGFCDTISHTTVAKMLKKRAKAASVPDVVSRQARRGVSGTHGADPCPVCAAVRPGLPRDLF
jgi:hypothetical protein